MINRRSAALIALLAPLAACVHGSDSTAPSPNPNAGFQVSFTPLGGLMPFPNDLYFGKNGQLAIPANASIAANAPLAALNHLDGYGTQSDISIYFTQAVDAKTLTPANVIVLHVNTDPNTKAITGVVGALVQDTDYSIGLSPGIDSGGSIVTIKPLKPLAASTVSGTTAVPGSYLVIVTRGVKDAAGDAVNPSQDYSTIVTADTPALAAGANPAKIAMAATDPLLPVAQFTLAQLAAAAGAGITPDKIAVTFSFSTQYEGISLASLAAQDIASPPGAQPSGTAIIDTGLSVCAVLVAGGKLPNTAACATVPGSTSTEVFAGSVALPYYLPVPSTSDPTAALTGYWKNAAGGDTAISATDPTSFLPKATVAQNIIPILVAIPTGCGAMPGSGWPVTIFQHGITRNREDMLAIAGGFGAACIATMAIDLPLHGVTDKTDPFYKNQLFNGTAAAAILTKPGTERTFDMDLENNTTGVAGADGKIDTSGAWFINLNSTITSRDNLREGAADLINLVASLPNLVAVTPPATLNVFDTSKVYFVGHSLGGIVGTTFLGADSAAAQLTSTAPKIVAASLASPGGHIAELLRNSVDFEPAIDAGLAANGLVKGTQSYYDFYSEAQAVVDDGDPANYAAAAAAGHPIHMLEVVGGLTGASDSCDLPDQVVPNSATNLLAVLMGLSQGTTPAGTTATVGPNVLVQFLAGDHGSILDPSVPSSCANDTAHQLLYGAVTQEMQTEVVSFMAGSGAGVPLNNTNGIIK